MRHINVTLPELFLVAATRGMLGVGIGLLVSDHLRRAQRRHVGWSLLTVGALSTVPLGMRILPRAIRGNTIPER